MKAVLGGAFAALSLACGGSRGPAGGPASGPADTHCVLPDGGVREQVVSASSCQVTGDAGILDYGATMYNAEADDDDCKYHVKFTSTPIYENTDVSFTVVATQKAGGAAAAGANVIAEIFLSDTHPAPNSNQGTSESPPGTFRVGPIRFDAPGKWTVRFHLHQDCADVLKDSPHGHAAFFIDVP
jgi:hypothetical protein